MTEGGAAGQGVAAVQEEEEKCGWGGGRNASTTHGAARGQQEGDVAVTWRRRHAGARRDGGGASEHMQEGGGAAPGARQAVPGGGGAPREQQQGLRRCWGSLRTGGATGEVVRRFFRRSRGAQVRLGAGHPLVLIGLHATAYLAANARLLDLLIVGHLYTCGNNSTFLSACMEDLDSAW